jgi:hypothetical protein
LPLVSDELRKLAAARLAAEPPGQTLQPTALVHEAYFWLVGSGSPDNWGGRGHFFAAAAEAMRMEIILPLDHVDVLMLEKEHAAQQSGAAPATAGVVGASSKLPSPVLVAPPASLVLADLAARHAPPDSAVTPERVAWLD